jgi:hypothetical protein
MFKRVVELRLEIVVTMLMDTLAVVVAIGCRWVALWVYRMATDGGSPGLPVRALELLLDAGLIATAFALVTFDFSKRLLNLWREVFPRSPNQ